MKTLKYHLFRSAVCGIIASPAFALEPPPDDAPPPPAPAGEAAAPVPGEAAPPIEMPVVGQVSAYLGVGSDGVPEILSTHLGLKAGEGVVVRTLDPDGPAAKAGISESDVIMRIGGKEVGSHETLSGIILGHKPGDEVEIDLIHQGKSEKKSVVLGERQRAVDAAPAAGAGDIAGVDDLNLDNIPEEHAERIREAIEKNLGAMEGLQLRQIPLEGDGGEIPQIDEAMREIEKRVAEMLKQAGGIAPQGGGAGQAQGMQLPIPGGPQGGGELQQMSSFRLQDDQGSVEMKSNGDGKEVTLRDKLGEVTWSGPWDTEQDKAAAPADVRERVERFSFGENGGINGMRFNLRMGGPGGRIEILPQAQEELEPEGVEEAPKEAPAEKAEEAEKTEKDSEE
jgi:hypothetical protein